MQKNFYAHTAPGVSYPEFISVNRADDGKISITVRSAPTFDAMQSDDPPLAVCGPTAIIALDRKLVHALITGLQKSVMDETELAMLEGRIPTNAA